MIVTKKMRFNPKSYKNENNDAKIGETLSALVTIIMINNDYNQSFLFFKKKKRNCKTNLFLKS